MMFDTKLIESLAKQFNEGGLFMWPILFVLACACAIAIERVIYYYVICRVNGGKLIADIAKALNADKIDEAEKIAAKKRIPVYALIKTALERYKAGMGQEDIQDGVEEAAIKELPRLSSRLNYLSLFANVATLLGLLGTIQGLQISFTSVASIEAAKKATMLAQGISVAMNTTAFGLIVAIPCMIVFTILSNKQKALTKDLDEVMVKLVNYMKKKRS